MKLLSIIPKRIRPFFFKDNIKPLKLTNDKVYLSVVAILKNEAAYIKEWLEYHRLVGVERFYLYDNESDDNVIEILKPYIDEGSVIYRYVKGKCLQKPVYKDAIYNYKDETRWLAIIDLDEFIVPVKEKTIPEFLKNYEKHPAVVANWVMFDSNGHKTAPGGLTIENYTRTAIDVPTNGSFKSIVNPKMVVDCFVYSCYYKYGKKAVDANFNEISPYCATADMSNTEKIRINHYYSKSEEEYIRKTKRGYADQVTTREYCTPLLDFTLEYQTKQDTLIVDKYLAELKKNMKERNSR